MVILEGRGLCKNFPSGDGVLQVLKNINVSISQGDAVCIVGESGAGKSTLLHLLGSLDQPTSGEVFYKGELLNSLDQNALAEFRNRNLGFVFQFHHLMPEFTAIENVIMPGRISGMSLRQCLLKGNKLLQQVGLEKREHHFPSQLSGGEQQRVAIARALFQRPEILLLDEPTGNLDRATSKKVQDLFFKIQEELGVTLLAVTHDMSFAERFAQKLSMVDGQFQ